MKVRKICQYCCKIFAPDPQVGNRQKFCGSAHCKNEHKNEDNRNWCKKNPEYLKGRYESYLKAWLKKHSGYLKAYRRRKKLQAQKDIQDKILLLKVQRIEQHSPCKKYALQNEMLRRFDELNVTLSELQLINQSSKKYSKLNEVKMCYLSIKILLFLKRNI